jgi:hypothetical protein
MSSYEDDEPTRGRCEDESGDGPPLSEIYTEFLEKQPAANDARNREWLDFFEANCQGYGWSDCSCEWWEEGRGEPWSAYAQTHGAGALPCNIANFLGDFIPRKMNLSSQETKAVAATLRWGCTRFWRLLSTL